MPPGIQIMSCRTLAPFANALLSELADSPALREPVTVPCVDVASPLCRALQPVLGGVLPQEVAARSLLTLDETSFRAKELHSSGSMPIGYDRLGVTTDIAWTRLCSSLGLRIWLPLL